MMTETVLPVAEQAELSEHQHRSFAPQETAHTFSLYDGVDECVEVFVWSGGSSDAAGACLHFTLYWETNGKVRS